MERKSEIGHDGCQLVQHPPPHHAGCCAGYVLIPLPLSPQGLSFHLGAVLLSLGFITYIEHGTFRRFTTRL